MADFCSSLSSTFSSLALSASQNDPSSSSPSLSDRFGSLGTRHDTILQLHESFGSFHPPRHSASLHLAPSSNVDLDPALWEELASQGVSLASVVQGLVAGMEKGGKLGILAADVYLGMMLAPGSPLYSLFSEIAFNALLRCIRNSCKLSSPGPDADVSGAAADRPRKFKGGKARRKRTAGTAIETEDGGDFDTESVPGHEEPFSRRLTDAPGVEDIFRVLARLQPTLRILHLKEHQESLRSLLELLVDFPHLVSEIQSENDAAGEGRGPRVRRMGVQTSLSDNSASSLTFDIMKALLGPAHGDQVNTAVILLKLLAPSILLTRAGGTNHQRAQIREHAIHFITAEMKSLNDPALRSALVALPRYLAMKAPEKTEPRAQAEEAVMAIVKSLTLENQRKFGHFVAKLSRGKPRHRLFAVDLAVALLGAVPDPLGLEKDADVGEQARGLEEPDDRAYSLDEDGPGDDERVANADGETALADGDENADREPGSKCPRPSDSDDCSPSSGTSGTKVWWGTACLEALLHRCSDKVPSIRARALTNLAEVLELLSTDIQNRAILQNLLGFGMMASAGSKEQEFSIRKSAIFNAWQTPGHGTPSLGGHTPSPEPSAPGPGASPLSPGAGHGNLGSLLKKRCVDEKVAVRKSTLFLMMKSASLLGRPPDDTVLEAMGSACADPMVSIRKAALGALSEVMRRFPADSKIVTEWLQSALPLIMDNESNIQEECLNHFEELVLDRIAAVAPLRLPGCSSNRSGRAVIDGVGGNRDAEQELERLLPPGTLLLLRGMADGGSTSSCVKRICTSLGSKKRLRAGVTLALQNIITASRTLWCSHSRGKPSPQAWTAPAGAWFLLAEASAFVPKAVGWEFLRNHWQLLEKQENAPTGNITPGKDTADSVQTVAWATDRVHLLQTISNVAIELPPDAAANLAAELLERLEGFDMHPTEVGAHVKALNTLCYRKAASADEGAKLVRIWVEELLEKSVVILNAYISVCSSFDKAPMLETFETPKPNRTQRKVAVGSSNQKQKCSESTSKDLRQPSCQIITAIFTVGALVLICPDARIENLVELLQTLITSSSSRPSDSSVDRTNIHDDITRGVHAQAWVTLGKICLANHDLAKRCIPLFLQARAFFLSNFISKL